MGHPTLCLVLHNHKKRKVLQGQGCVALRSEDIDCEMTAEEFLEKWNKGESQKKLKKKLLLYSSNVADYRNGSLGFIFHTTSMPEYHDPYLRLIMASYVRELMEETVKSTM
eukprot:2534586-Ditylum_brightwellii.AAC.1